MYEASDIHERCMFEASKVHEKEDNNMSDIYYLFYKHRAN